MRTSIGGLGDPQISQAAWSIALIRVQVSQDHVLGINGSSLGFSIFSSPSSSSSSDS